MLEILLVCFSDPTPYSDHQSLMATTASSTLTSRILEASTATRILEACGPQAAVGWGRGVNPG